ncbi:hypothetical protein [Streptomyces sp. NPDC057686]|uniref:hypothetical protein n=1 Tax=Streptomyces sp. NPDC057686 TaxID=3346212 RepID=UPI00369C465F
MTNDPDALLTALYVKIDDEITDTRWLGRPPRLTDSELVCLAVAQAMLGFTSESRWLRFVGCRLGEMFPFVPKQPGWNKRLRAALPLVKRAVRLLATDTDFWFDNHWIIDSTPVACGRSRPTVKRSDLAGWAGYGTDTDTAQAIPDSSGACGHTWCAPRPVCRSCGPLRTRSWTSARC